jgi:hypothetical protein
MRRHGRTAGALFCALISSCSGGGAGSGSDGSSEAGEASSAGSTAGSSSPTGTGSENMTSGTSMPTGDPPDPTGTGDPTLTGGSGPVPIDCGGFTPGNDFNVCTATYLGGAGADTPGGVEFAPDNTLVVGGGFPGHNFGVAPTVIAEGDGAVVRLSSDGTQVLSVTRLAAAVRDVAVAPDGTIAVVGGFGVASLSADGSAALWTAAIGDASRVAVGADGSVAALRDQQVDVFSADGSMVGSFGVSGTAINDIAVHGDSLSVLATGYRQSDQGACQQYKSTFIRSYGYDGAIKWVDYDWDGEDVDDTEDCADSTGFGLSIGRDGKLYYAAKSDGGNTVHRKDPRDLNVEAPNVATDPYDTPYGLKGANAVGYYARFDPVTGAHEGGQFLVSRKAGLGEDPAAAEANAAPPDSATGLADGTIVVIGGSAYLMQGHDEKSVDGLDIGEYTAYEPYVLIVSPDFTKRLAWTVFTAEGPGFARAVAAGEGGAAVLFGQSLDDAGKGPLLTVDALQAAPGGGAETWLTVFPTP